MRRIYFFAVWSFVIGLAVAVAAGRPHEKQQGNSSQTTAAAQNPQPKPSPQIERLLHAFEGTWGTREKFAPDAASPNGATAEGKIVWRPGPGGFSAVEEYQSRQGNTETTGMGVFWWDDAAHGYRTIWCDSTNPGGCISFKSVLRWEGLQLVLIEDYEVNNKKLTFKEAFGNISSSTFTQTLYGGPRGGELKIDQTIQAAKLTNGAGSPRE